MCGHYKPPEGERERERGLTGPFSLSWFGDCAAVLQSVLTVQPVTDWDWDRVQSQLPPPSPLSLLLSRDE